MLTGKDVGMDVHHPSYSHYLTFAQRDKLHIPAVVCQVSWSS